MYIIIGHSHRYTKNGIRTRNDISFMICNISVGLLCDHDHVARFGWRARQQSGIGTGEKKNNNNKTKNQTYCYRTHVRPGCCQADGLSGSIGYGKRVGAARRFTVNMGRRGRCLGGSHQVLPGSSTFRNNIIIMHEHPSVRSSNDRTGLPTPSLIYTELQICNFFLQRSTITKY